MEQAQEPIGTSLMDTELQTERMRWSGMLKNKAVIMAFSAFSTIFVDFHKGFFGKHFISTKINLIQI